MIAKGDRAARHSAVEGRYPFLDDDVVAFCASIAPEYKLRGFTDKWLLRRVAAKILPAEIADRKKTMFRAHWSETFLGPDRPAWVDQLLSPESLARAPATSTRRAWRRPAAACPSSAGSRRSGWSTTRA